MVKKKDFIKSIKYSFTLEYQMELLRYLVQSKESMVIIPKIKPNYFTLIEHALITEAIQKFAKKHQRVPSEPMIIEQIKNLLEGRDYADLVTKDDIPNIHKVVKNIYNIPLKDEDILKDSIYKFAAYIEMKNLNESIDLSDFDSYEKYQNQISKILQDSKAEKKDEGPLFMVQGTTKRQMLRKIAPNIIPSPIKQLNALTNGGGLPKNTIAVIIDRPKKKKTFSLINLARGYLAMKKNVLYIDLENGKNHIMERMIQSTLNRTKKEMLTGDFDKLEQKHMRKYKRLGVEFIVERLPARASNANTIQHLINKVEKERNIKIHVLMLDFAAKLNAISGEKDDTKRIGEVYIDLDNLAVERDLDVIWTAQHVTRDGGKHSNTKYEDNDIASAIDIIRHVQLAVGLNQTLEEEENGVQRLEIVAQRDGIPSGRALFNVDVAKQRWKEFSKEARDEYDKNIAPGIDEMINKEYGHKKKREKVVNPNADKKKAAKKSGDI